PGGVPDPPQTARRTRNIWRLLEEAWTMTDPQQDMAPTTLSHYINDWAEKTPERTFYISTDTGDELSFLQLQQHCQSLASQFVQLGYQPGDKVSVFMPNCQTTAVMQLVVMASGLVVNPINLLRSEERRVGKEWGSRRGAYCSGSDNVDGRGDV